MDQEPNQSRILLTAGDKLGLVALAGIGVVALMFTSYSIGYYQGQRGITKRLETFTTEYKQSVDKTLREHDSNNNALHLEIREFLQTNRLDKIEKDEGNYLPLPRPKSSL